MELSEINRDELTKAIGRDFNLIKEGEVLTDEQKVETLKKDINNRLSIPLEKLEGKSVDDLMNILKVGVDVINEYEITRDYRAIKESELKKEFSKTNKKNDK